MTTRPLTDRELRGRVQELVALARPCQLCPRRCGAERRSDDSLGFCRQTLDLEVAATCPHGGEEPPLSGTAGAGTVFVAGCTMRCHFCQNHQISQPPRPLPDWRTTPEGLARRFLDLQARGCHNIEWVSPTSHLPGLVEALRLARGEGLHLPVVLNCNGYHRVTVLQLLEGIVDVYLPDAKYGSDLLAERLSATSGYVERNRRALSEMARQVGPLRLDADTGLARRGLLVRHLVLPGHLDNTRRVLRWIGETLGPDTWVSLMAQYFPAHRARTVGLPRPLTRREYDGAVEALCTAGLDNGWVQDLRTGRDYRPDFLADDPFPAGAP